MHLRTCPWEGPRCHRHRRRPTVALASLTLAVASLAPAALQPTRSATTVAATAVTSASLTIPEPEPSSAVAVAATAVAVAVATHRKEETATQSWKVLLPQKFDKQVFDGWRNDPRDVPRMAPLRLPEARAREAGRH